MKRITFALSMILCLVMLFQVTGSVSAQDEIMPVAELRAGMTGIGKTVISGTNVEEFNVEILGILKGQSSVGDLILCRVSGSLIDKTGGIAEGMSGSPVYIDGKVIGAIGYSWGLTDHRLGLITPIETMLKVLDLDRLEEKEDQWLKPDLQRPVPKSKETSSLNTAGAVQLAETIEVDGREIGSIYFAQSYDVAVAEDTAVDQLVAYPARTPLLVSGLTGRALERLMKDLQQFDLVPIVTGTSTGSGDADSLEPGSAVAAQLVRGDIDVSAVGTLTYRTDEQFVAFGHPFLRMGQVEYFLSGAEILTVVDSLDMPFKLGVAGKPMGTVTQDRNAAIGGRLNQLPTIIPVSVVVHDLDQQVDRELDFQVVRDEELMVSLITNAVLQVADTVMDRQGYGTSTMKLEMVGDKLPDHMLRYSNMYYSENDIAAQSLADLYSIVDLVARNPYEKVNIGSIKVEMEVVRNRQVAVIEEVKLLNTELYPGDTAKVEVTLRPYRGSLITQVYEVKIPENLQPGDASLIISGGIFGAYGSGEPMPEEGDSDTAVGEHYKSLTESLEGYLQLPRNHELIIEIMPYYSEEVSDFSGEDGVEADDATPRKSTKVAAEKSSKVRSDSSSANDNAQKMTADPIRELFPTEYVLEGSLNLEVTIIAPTPAEDEDTNPEGNTLND